MHTAISLIKQTFSDWMEDKAPRLGAALAYYAIFSIPPLLVITISAIGLFYDGDIRGALAGELGSLIGPEAAETIMETDQQQSQQEGVMATLFGLALLLFGASGVFAQLQD